MPDFLISLFQHGQPAKAFAEIRQNSPAPTAYGMPALQIITGHFYNAAAVAPASPAHLAVSAFRPVQHSEQPKPLSSQINQPAHGMVPPSLSA